MRKVGLMMVLGLMSVGMASESYAQGYNWNWWGGGGYNRLVQTDRQIPYFAEFPPVYYSHIVPRSYGQSPYAYWPGPFNPPVVDAPMFIDNPHLQLEEVPPAPAPKEAPKKEKSASHRTVSRRATEPLVVLNPYVEQRATVADHSGK